MTTRSGPWGAGIRYWLKRLDRSQAFLCSEINARRQLAAGSGPIRLVQRKTISAIVRGFHTQTRLLEEIAAVLGVPLDAVLIAPDHQLHQAHQRILATEIADQVMRRFAREPSVDDVISSLDRAVALEERDQRTPKRLTKRPAHPQKNHR